MAHEFEATTLTTSGSPDSKPKTKTKIGRGEDVGRGEGEVHFTPNIESVEWVYKRKPVQNLLMVITQQFMHISPQVFPPSLTFMSYFFHL